MDNKSARKEKAINHTEQMNKEYSIMINASITNSMVYTDDNIYNNNINIVVDNMSTTEAVSKYKNEHKLCVLNFASYKKPGGGFINGAIAQEESICHDSTLFNVISSEKFESYYEDNKNNTNDGLYRNAAIYSPSIVFSNSKAVVNVITCAAPNLSIFKGPKYKAYDTIRNRIKFILDIAEKNNETELILGAFGCGVFKNDPEFVASTFKDLLYSTNYYHFKKVIFAIPGGINYDIFKKTFE